MCQGNALLRLISFNLSLSFSMTLCVTHIQNRVLFLGQGAPVVLWESICAHVLLLNPGYVNHREKTPTNNDSPSFNCITGLFLTKKSDRVMLCKGRAVLVDSFPAH